MVVLIIPLIDSSLNINLYKVHNLPMLHPTLGVQVEYELEGEYLAILIHGMYATIPHATDIKLCKMSQGHLCMLDHTLYPVNHVEWCLYTLFTNSLEKIKSNCIVKPTQHSTNLAHSLDGYLWAVSSVAAEKVQIRCVQDTSVVTIHPPMRIIDVDNRCKAFSPNIYILAKSELTTTLQSLPRSHFFQEFNLKYTNISVFVVFHNLSMATLTPEECTHLCSKVCKLQPMHMEMFQQKLKLIDEDYPFTLLGWLQFTLQISSGLTLVMVGIALVWFCIRHRSHLAALWKISSTLVTKLKENPDLFPHLLSVGTDFLNWQHSPTPPPHLGPLGDLPLEKSSTDVGSASASSRVSSQNPPVNSRSLVPSVPHHNTLEFITQAAQELYSQGKLRTKSYSAHLKKEL